MGDHSSCLHSQRLPESAGLLPWHPSLVTACLSVVVNMFWRGLHLRALSVAVLASSLAVQASAGPLRQLIGLLEATNGGATNGVALGGWPVRNREAVFSGDVLATSVASSALVLFSGVSQASVLQQSTVRFKLEAGEHPVAHVSSGMVLTTTEGMNLAIIETAKYRIEPAEQKRTIYLVGVLPDRSTLVAARRGGVSITSIRSGKSYLLGGGRYIIIASSALGVPGQEQEKNKQAAGKPAGQAAPPSSPSQHQPQPQPKPVREAWHIGSLSHGASIALIIAAAGGAGAVVAAAVSGGGPSASPSAP